MQSRTQIVFLLDVDNALLDNDRIIDDLKRHVENEFGASTRDRYFAIFEQLRSQLGYADYLGALQRYRLEDECDPRLLLMSCFLVDYPFAERLYPEALNVVSRVGRYGTSVILSDGDAVFQPRKIERSGLWDAVKGRVLIYIHKEQMLHDVERHYPASHYVMVDDKLRILTAMKEVWQDRLTTVFVRQGKYALDPAIVASYPSPDFTVECIRDLMETDLSFLTGIAESPDRDMTNRCCERGSG